MSEDELKNRLETAVKVLDEGLSRNDFIFVVNESSHESAEEIDAYVHERTVMADQNAARDLARQIRHDLTNYLSTH